MSAERDELRRLVEERPAEVSAVAQLRLQVASPTADTWPPAWFGAASGQRTDTAARSEDLLKDGFGRSATPARRCLGER